MYVRRNNIFLKKIYKIDFIAPFAFYDREKIIINGEVFYKNFFEGKILNATKKITVLYLDYRYIVLCRFNNKYYYMTTVYNMKTIRRVLYCLDQKRNHLNGFPIYDDYVIQSIKNLYGLSEEKK